MPTMPHNPSPAQIASQAQHIVDTLEQTDYQHHDKIDVDKGIYDCDCNGFVGFVLKNAAPAHFALVPKEETQSRPRAFKYYGFFASLTPESPGGWHRIDFLKDAHRGDIIAWRFPRIEKDANTGHVVFVAEKATVDESGVFSVRVYDSAKKPHFDDTRGTGQEQFPTGVGSGVIHFKVDGAGRPTAYQFSPPTSADFDYVQIAIGRAEPL
jgi:hypothetical protein